jgi:serine/threonine protein kinase
MTTTLGSYELGEVVGRGSMGDVHRGVRIGSEDPIAVKVLRSELVADPEVLARFLQERSILCSVDHPNLVRVHDLVVEGGSAAIVMDLVDGSDLRRVLRDQGTLSPSEASQLILQLLSALEKVHGMGIVHRDIKPENLLVGSNGEVRLTDFGIARLTYGPSLTRMTGLIGTPEYLAPELAEYELAAPAADIYATGILFYELLTGFTPFTGGHPVAVLRRHLELEPPRPSGLPDPLWDLMSSMLAKDPAVRPTAEGAMATLTALGPALEGVTALPPTRPARDDDDSPTVLKGRLEDPADDGTILKSAGRRAEDPVRSRRRRIAVAAVAAVVLISVVGGAVVATGGQAATQTKAVFAFKPQVFSSGLIVNRTWTLSGPTGDHLNGTATLSHNEPSPLLTTYTEVLPRSVASNVKHVTFTPHDDQVIQADPVVLFPIGLGAGITTKLTFSADVGPTSGAWPARLAQLAEAQETAELHYFATTHQTAPVTLRTLRVNPTSLTMAAGQSQPVGMSGTMSDGTPAPSAALAGVAWSTSAPTVAAVDNGIVFALAAGSATITAQAGSVTVDVAVTVSAPAGPATGVRGPASGGGSATNTASAASGSGKVTATTAAKTPTQSAGGGNTAPAGSSSTTTPTTVAPVTATTTPPVQTPPTTAPPTATTQPAPGPPTPPQNLRWQQDGVNDPLSNSPTAWGTPVWSAPASDGGSTIANYEVSVVIGPTPDATVYYWPITAVGVNNFGNICVDSPSGTPYYFKVFAVNAAGFDSPVAQSPAIECP